MTNNNNEIKVTPYKVLKKFKDEFCEEGYNTAIIQAIKLKLGKKKFQEILEEVTWKECKQLSSKMGFESEFEDMKVFSEQLKDKMRRKANRN